MPLYEYECTRHGTFEEIQPMQRSAEPAQCPACGGQSPRVLSATRITTLSRASARAHAHNEKSRHSPEVCSGHDLRAPGASARSRGAATAQPGDRRPLHVHRGARPWVIEHG